MICINNVKISCKLPAVCLSYVEKICLQKKISYKLFTNFIVFLAGSFTYTLFKKKYPLDSLKDCKKQEKCHCNITKCLFSNVEAALKILCTLIQCKFSDLNYVTDTITASGSLGYNLNLENFIFQSKGIPNKIMYNPEKFQGLFISVKSSMKGIFFQSGKCVIVGCKSLREIKDTRKWLIQKVAIILKNTK